MEAPWERAVGGAAEAALRGALIVFPTDTVYGIGTRPDDPDATDRLFAAKGRERDLGLPVLAATRAGAEEVALLDDRARVLASRFWPGPLSIVCPRTERSRSWALGSDAATVAVRVPHHPLALALLALTGPLATTSANRSGKPTPSTCDALRSVFGDAVDVYLCQEQPLEGRASTVVDLTGSDLTIVREGDLGERELRQAFRDVEGDPEGPR